MTDIEIPTIEPVASPDLSTPWVPLWPLQPTAPVGLYPIFDTTLAALANDIDITSIPQTFRTLKLVASLRTTEAALLSVINAQFNGDTSAAYFNQQVRGFTTTADAAGAALGNTAAKLGNMNGATATAGYHATLIAELPFYSGTQPKGMISRWHRWSDDTQTEIGQVGAIWKQVGAINRIRIFPAAGQFVAGCRVTLYGLDPVAPVIPTINPSYGTSFPASPVTGQEHILVDSVSNPTYQWRFRYNAGSASAYKWEFVGGSPYYQRIDTDEGGVAVAGPVDLATVGPQMTLPRAGDYACRHGAEGYITAAASIFLYLRRAAVTVSTAIQYSGGITVPVTVTHEAVATGAAASDVLKLQYGTNGGTANFRKRWIAITPVRVS